uniref:chorismate-binding protein n=1 Tax=Escherichia coli TaxID=562 RepID=UPI001CCD1EE2
SPELSNAAIIKGVFPGGSITGSPKLRTMEIIEELEPTRRGLYTGSIGWVGFNGDMELNIVIRTAYIKDGVAHIQAGAG